MNIVVELTEAEAKALAWAVADPEEWVVYAAKERCRIAMEEIFQVEVQRMLADPTVTEIPADREKVVLGADITTAAQRNAEAEGSLAFDVPVGQEDHRH